jgi:hypothetical protein
MVNPGIFYAFYTISLAYLSYRFHQAGIKGSLLAKDYSRFIFVFVFALGSVAAGLLFFPDQPNTAAFVSKIIGFGFWYLALVFVAPVFCKVVMPTLSQKIPIIIFTLFGIFLTIYHLLHLTPLVISADGVPLWNIDPIITMTQGFVSVAYLGVASLFFALQAIKAKHTARGVLFGGGTIGASLFTPLTYMVENRALFIALTFLTILAYTVLMISLWTHLWDIAKINYFNNEQKTSTPETNKG